MICPRCGYIKKEVLIANLTFHGFSCPKCGDGVSYPEKLMSLVLKALGIKYKVQHMFDGYRYKYDFYLIDYDIIIEVHGGQHYKDCSRSPSWKSYEDEHENDLVKYDLAVLNGYEYNKNYFVINAKKSNINCIRNSIEQCEFFKQFDLSNIDWQEIDKQAQTSQKIDICKCWKEQKEINKDLTVTDLAKEFGVSNVTIRNYLTWGDDNGLCEYNAKQERQAQIKRNSIFVVLVKPYGEKWFEEPMSQTELARKSGIHQTTICDYTNSGKPLKRDSHAKYDPKYIGSYIMTVEDYNLKYGSN